MKVALRCLFGGLAMLTMVTQAARLTSSDVRSDSATDLAGGLARLGLQVATTAQGVLTATHPDCPEPVALGWVNFDGTNDNTMRAPLPTATVARYAYLGFLGGDVDKVAIGSRWVAASALSALGVRRGAVPRAVVVVRLPKACPELNSIDWSALSPWSASL
jgi:hypothetical protein